MTATTSNTTTYVTTNHVKSSHQAHFAAAVILPYVAGALGIAYTVFGPLAMLQNYLMFAAAVVLVFPFWDIVSDAVLYLMPYYRNNNSKGWFQYMRETLHYRDADFRRDIVALVIIGFFVGLFWTLTLAAAPLLYTRRDF